MKTKKLLTVITILSLFLPGNSCFSQTAEELLPKAIQLEEVQGELEQAIEIYQTIVDDFPNEREIAAKALLRMGQCYEKLGKQEAENAYQKIISEFSDQKNEVEKAKTHLAALNRSTGNANPSRMVFTQVWAPALGSAMGKPSPDERYISFNNWTAKPNLAIHDIETGENRDITTEGIYSEHGDQEPDFSIWSKDGKKIAYSWYIGSQYDLRTINADGSELKILYREEGFWAAPLDWSPDGRFILAERGRRGGPHQLVIFSLSDGSFKVLKTLKETGFYGINNTKHNMSFSKDGRYVLFNLHIAKNSFKSDIYLVDLNSGKEIILIDHPENDINPFWTPDGKGIVFFSNRTGKMGLWKAAVENGKIKGVPQLILRNQEDIIPLELTPKGSLYYGKRFSEQGDVYIASIDLKTGKMLSAPEKVTNSFEGHNTQPAWSPDGKYLAYASRREEQGKNIVIRTVETGAERVFAAKPILGRRWENPVWSPDGSSIIVLLRDSTDNYKRNFYSIDIQTGEHTLFIKRKENTRFALISPPFFSPKGKQIYYNIIFNDRPVFVEHDLETGDEKKLMSEIAEYVLSPDGSQIAYNKWDEDGNKAWFEVVPFSGGEAKQILGLKVEVWPELFTWTPDGKSLLYGKVNGDVTELWKISAEGGEPVKMELEIKGLHHLSIHPDGRRVVFESSKDNNLEIWKIENFLTDSN